jgi:hypothetical protein
MLALSLDHIILVLFGSRCHCFCDLWSHFEALESVLLLFFLVYAWKKYDQTDSDDHKCLPRVTKTVTFGLKKNQYYNMVQQNYV